MNRSKKREKKNRRTTYTNTKNEEEIKTRKKLIKGEKKK